MATSKATDPTTPTCRCLLTNSNSSGLMAATVAPSSLPPVRRTPIHHKTSNNIRAAGQREVKGSSKVIVNSTYTSQKRKTSQMGKRIREPNLNHTRRHLTSRYSMAGTSHSRSSSQNHREANNTMRKKPSQLLMGVRSSGRPARLRTPSIARSSWVGCLTTSLTRSSKTTL
jgi:hypothetical protein